MLTLTLSCSMLTNWPLALWLVKSYLVNLGYHVGTLRAQHTPAERDKIVGAFNDPNSPVQILVTSLRVGATSYNLQKACHHMVVMDVPQGANILLQAIGRLFRIHQHHTVVCWIVTADATYDGPLQANAAVKFILQLTGQGEVSVTDEKLKAALKRVQTDEDEDVKLPVHSDIEEALLMHRCDEHYQVMFRQRSQ